MEIEFRLFATVRDAVGARTKLSEFETGATVRDALATLENDHPDLTGKTLTEGGEIARNITVLRNGTNVTHFEGAATELSDGDSLSITLPVTGG